jgi:hypothetical protein
MWLFAQNSLYTPALIWAGSVFFLPTHQLVSPASCSPYSHPYFEPETILTLSNFRICLFSLYGIRIWNLILFAREIVSRGKANNVINEPFLSPHQLFSSHFLADNSTLAVAN